MSQFDDDMQKYVESFLFWKLNQNSTKLIY